MTSLAFLAPASILLAAGLASGQTAPVAFDDAYTTAQDDNLSVDDPGVLSNDDDADGDPLTAVLVDSSGTVGTLLLESDGSFEYEPGGFLGVESFTYKANDGGLDSNPATITFTVTAGTTATGYTDEGLYLDALLAQGFTPMLESFEDAAVWGAVRSPNTAPSVTSQGITWESPIGVSEVTTGPGPALHGGFGFFALPHGDYLAGPQCLTPGVCTDRWKGTSPQPLVAIGGWITAAGQGKVELYLDGDTANPIDLGGGGVTSYRFFGVIAPLGFQTFEFREMEGTSDDAAYLFGDKFLFARSEPSAWTDEGSALAGVAGDPRLAGSGTLAAGSDNAVDLSNAAPSATAGLFLALASTPVPFKGGTLVPVPFFEPVIVTTSGTGSLPLPFVMPVGVPAGTELWVQWAIQDAAAVKGVSLSNAVLGLTP
jgi:hypothetical protein